MSGRSLRARAAAVLLLAACGDRERVASSPAGLWTGTGTANQVTFGLTLDLLVDDQGVVTGSGQLAVYGGTMPFTVAGTWQASRLTLTLSDAGTMFATFTGTMQADGTLHGLYLDGGYNGELILRRTVGVERLIAQGRAGSAGSGNEAWPST